MKTRLHSNKSSWLKSPAGISLVVLLIIGTFFLLTAHTAHVVGALPYLLFLAIPFMHIFMHGGHGTHGAHGKEGEAYHQNHGESQGTTSPQRDRSVSQPELPPPAGPDFSNGNLPAEVTGNGWPGQSSQPSPARSSQPHPREHSGHCH